MHEITWRLKGLGCRGKTSLAWLSPFFGSGSSLILAVFSLEVRSLSATQVEFWFLRWRVPSVWCGHLAVMRELVLAVPIRRAFRCAWVPVSSLFTDWPRRLLYMAMNLLRLMLAIWLRRMELLLVRHPTSKLWLWNLIFQGLAQIRLQNIGRRSDPTLLLFDVLRRTSVKSLLIPLGRQTPTLRLWNLMFQRPALIWLQTIRERPAPTVLVLCVLRRTSVKPLWIALGRRTPRLWSMLIVWITMGKLPDRCEIRVTFLRLLQFPSQRFPCLIIILPMRTLASQMRL